MDRQDRLIEKLIQRNIFKLKDGRDLFEGSCEELERLLKGKKTSMAYPREEQETTPVFETKTGQWMFSPTVPKHIRKLSNLCELQTLEEEGGN